MRIANHLISLLWLGLSLELISAHIDPLPLRSPPLSEPDPLGHTLHRHGKRARDPRLGSVFRSIPVYRTLGGTNVVTVGLGGREVGDVTQRLNVTVSTSVQYVMAATTDCAGCVDSSGGYTPSFSPTIIQTPLSLLYTYTSPQPYSPTRNPASRLNVSGSFVDEYLNDNRSDTSQRRLVLVDGFVNDRGRGATGLGGRFAQYSSGFWGLGVDPSTPSNSLIPSVMASDPDVSALTVGINLNSYGLDTSQPAGEIHWGAVPEGVYNGDWNWLAPMGGNTSLWEMPFNQFKVDGRNIGSNLRALIDPAYFIIIVPESVATAIYDRIDGASRDISAPDRWNIPCETDFKMEISLPGGTYSLNNTGLVQHRNRNTCWGGITAWTAGSLPDVQGLVVLGVPFLATVYTALSYSLSGSYIGLANKPGTGGGFIPRGNRLSGGAIAGIIIGLLALTFILLAVLLSRSRETMAGYYSRLLKKQHKIATAQMSQIDPLMQPPSLVLGAAPVFAEPRHVDGGVYARPFLPGMKNMQRVEAMNNDPLGGYYKPEQYVEEEEGYRQPGFWGGWRRAKEEREWRKQNGRGVSLVSSNGMGGVGEEVVAYDPHVGHGMVDYPPQPGDMGGVPPGMGGGMGMGMGMAPGPEMMPPPGMCMDPTMGMGMGMGGPPMGPMGPPPGMIPPGNTLPPGGFHPSVPPHELHHPPKGPAGAGYYARGRGDPAEYYGMWPGDVPEHHDPHGHAYHGVGSGIGEEMAHGVRDGHVHGNGNGNGKRRKRRSERSDRSVMGSVSGGGGLHNPHLQPLPVGRQQQQQHRRNRTTSTDEIRSMKTEYGYGDGPPPEYDQEFVRHGIRQGHGQGHGHEQHHPERWYHGQHGDYRPEHGHGQGHGHGGGGGFMNSMRRVFGGGR